MVISPNAAIDFSYPWWLSYGHLAIVLPAGVLLLVGYLRKWSRWMIVLSAVLVIWASAAFVVTRFVFDINGQPSLPTQNFLSSGKGRVLDIGAGTGRSSIMVLASRPQSSLVALDLFGHSFEQHFGPEEQPERKLVANLKAAGVEQRATIVTADMRKLPFEPASFDAIVSAYAIDHLGRQGIDQALFEAARVVKPGGDFLLMLIANDRWVKFAFGPILSHGGTRGSGYWNERLQQAGFKVIEEGSVPLTLYLLARKP
jgi:SAM-dependent methyltransferase